MKIQPNASVKKKNFVQETKSSLRKRLLNLLRNQKEEERIRKSRMITVRLFATPEFQRSRTVLFYASFDGEVETFNMMKQAQKLGKTIALPTIAKDRKEIIPAQVEKLEDLKEGHFGIKYPSGQVRPLDVQAIDLVIVPGIAFDRDNNRLGRGAGYYDRFLSRLPSGIPTVGLAFDFQIVKRLPQLVAHDRPVSRVIVN